MRDLLATNKLVNGVLGTQRDDYTEDTNAKLCPTSAFANPLLQTPRSPLKDEVVMDQTIFPAATSDTIVCLAVLAAVFA